MASVVDLLEFDRAELVDELGNSLSLPPFRARQLTQWIHRRRVTDFHSMTDISLSVRQQLADQYTIFRPEVKKLEKSRDGSRKYLLQLKDGAEVESVFVKQETRNTLCVSSQVGCAIGCTFCRTALMGLRRNLGTAEIVGQVLAVKDDLEPLLAKGSDCEINNVVFMGMGEPLQNLDNVVRAVRILNDDLGHNFSGRRVTVSTSGLVPAIDKFGQSDCFANLALSLNATTDAVRDQIMPINKRWPIGELIAALKRYPLKKRERITIEYVLLKGVNDSEKDLARLPQLLRGLQVKVNLIPYNANACFDYQAPSSEEILAWQKGLLSCGVNATVRWSKGEDISAACGQLATESAGKGKGHEDFST